TRPPPLTEAESKISPFLSAVVATLLAKDPLRRFRSAAELSEVMTSRPRTVSTDMAFSDALHIMHEGGFRHVPVVKDGRPVGMISCRDALGPELEDFIYELLRQERAQDVLSG
ncbi:MAG: CBS domain-containing protein, partial [Burkholderiales bacterium]